MEKAEVHNIQKDIAEFDPPLRMKPTKISKVCGSHLKQQ